MEWFNDLPFIIRLAVYCVAGSIVFGAFLTLLGILASLLLGVLEYRDVSKRRKRRARMRANNPALRRLNDRRHP